jgi:hypothetical protein
MFEVQQCRVFVDYIAAVSQRKIETRDQCRLSSRAYAITLLALALAGAAGLLFRAALAALDTSLALFLETDMFFFAAMFLFRALVRW